MAARFPPKVIARLLHYLDPSESRVLVKHYRTVSRQWQAAAELDRGAFSSITVRSDELDEFSTVFTARHRRRSLSKLVLKTILPTYNLYRCVMFETRAEQNKHNEIVTEVVRALFSVLSRWEADDSDDGVYGNPIDLSIIAYSPMDIYWRSSHFQQVFKAEFFGVAHSSEFHRYELYPGMDIKQRRWRHSYLRLSRPVGEGLPQLKRITRLSTKPEEQIDSKLLNWRPRIFEGWMLAKLAAKLPNLEVIDWIVRDGDLLYPRKRIKHRKEFALALMEAVVSLQSLTTFVLDTKSSHITGDTFTGPQLNDDNVLDPLTVALQHILRLPSLHTFNIERYAVISPHIFDIPLTPNPELASPSNNLPFQNITVLKVRLSSITPEGTYYFAASQSLPEAFKPPAPKYDPRSDLEDSEHSGLIADHSKTAKRIDPGPELDSTGQNSEEDSYPYPTQYSSLYKRDNDQARGRGHRFFHRDLIDTDDIRAVYTGFLSLLRQAPKIEEAFVGLGVRRYRGRASHIEIAYGYFGSETKSWGIRLNSGMQTENAIQLFRHLKDRMLLVDGSAKVYGPLDLLEVFPGVEEVGILPHEPKYRTDKRPQQHRHMIGNVDSESDML